MRHCIILCLLAVVVRTAASGVSVMSVGGVLCQAHSGRYGHKCPPQKCGWDNWYHKHYDQPDKPIERVVLSYGHCGFGNQIFQHNYAQMVAEQTDSAFFATKIPNKYVTGGLHWAESKAGYLNAKPMINPQLLWEHLPSNHSAKVLCSRNNVTIGYRPTDRRNPKAEWNSNIQDFIEPRGPAKCLVLLGFFQEFIPCLKMRQSMWKGVFDNQDYTTFQPKDMVVHMRCLGGHYPPPSKLYIEAVLNNTKYDRLFIFKPPGPCRNRGKGTVFDNTYIINLLIKRYGAEYFKKPNATGLTDFLDLSSAYQVIETASTYSFWSGMFSNQNATIHVDTSFHRVVPDDHRFVYHDPGRKKFYGTYSSSEGKIKYRVTGNDVVRDLVRATKTEREELKTVTKDLHLLEREKKKAKAHRLQREEIEFNTTRNATSNSSV